jgi:predicted RNA-binding protein with TRAM domain
MYNDRKGGFRRGGGGGGGQRDFDDKPKPVKVGDEYDVEISDVGAKGDGITKVENFIIFVAGTTKNEKCKIKITSVSSRFAVGEKVGDSDAGESDAPQEETPAEESETTEETA